MTTSKRLSRLKALQKPITSETTGTIQERRAWLAEVTPLLNFNELYHRNFMEAADILGRPNLSSNTYDQAAARLESILAQAIVELEHDLTPKVSPKNAISDSEPDSLGALLSKLSLSGRVFLFGLLVSALLIGVQATRMGWVREWASLPEYTKVETIPVRVPAERNVELDKKIAGWIDSNQTRIAELHKELINVESNIRILALSADRQKIAEDQAKRLNESIIRENQTFGENLREVRGASK